MDDAETSITELYSSSVLPDHIHFDAEKLLFYGDIVSGDLGTYYEFSVKATKDTGEVYY